MLRVEKQGTRLVPLGCLDLEPISLPRSDEFRQYIANSWQEFFAEVGHNLFLNGTAVDASDNGLESVDLLAVDKDGRTVVVSLHRDDEPSQLTRGLVCASRVASWDPPQILEYLSPRSTRDLETFLTVDINAINQEQRLLLIAESFKDEDLLAAKWLAQAGRVEVTCVHVTLAVDRQSQNEYLSCVQVFPPFEDQGQRSQLKEAAETTAILGDETKTLPKGIAGVAEVLTDEVEQALDSAPSATHSPLETSSGDGTREAWRQRIAQLDVKEAAESAEDTGETSSLMEPDWVTTLASRCPQLRTLARRPLRLLKSRREFSGH